MKAHNVATVLFFVVLIALGYAFTVWTHSIHVPEEDEAAVEGAHDAGEEHASETSEGEAASAAAASAAGAMSGAEGGEDEAEAGPSDADASEPEDTAEAADDETAEPQADDDQQEAATTEPQAPVAESDEPAMAGRSGRVTLALARGDEAAVTLTLFAGAEPLDVGNWRLSDSLGEAGDAGHVLYFDEGRRLAPGAPLTVVSGCGRDREGTLYWCLTHPESLWNAAEGAFYLRDDRGELALVCDPAQRSEDRVLYECAP